jgi:ACS family allantoate permease-like MFS transporter
MPKSISSVATDEKSIEAARPARVVSVHDLGLPDLKEEDVDEGRELAGDVRHVFTQEEKDAVKRKIDRRVLPILAAVYFSQFLDKNSLK